MFNKKLMVFLAKIDPKVFYSREELKEAGSIELPMSQEEGLALRVLTPVDLVHLKHIFLSL